MTDLADEDRVRGNVYALLGNLLAAAPDARLLEVLSSVAPEPDDDSLLAASWQMLALAAARGVAAQSGTPLRPLPFSVLSTCLV